MKSPDIYEFPTDAASPDVANLNVIAHAVVEAIEDLNWALQRISALEVELAEAKLTKATGTRSTKTA